MKRRWIAALVAVAALLVSVPAWAARLGRFDRYVIGANGTPVTGASVEVRKQGAWTVQGGAQTGDTGDGADVINVVHKGRIQTNDTVVIGTGTTAYTVGTVTNTTIELTAGGVFNIPAGSRLSPTTNKPTLYIDNQGITTKGNPLTTSSIGQAECWVADGVYDWRLSDGGALTRLITDYYVGGVQKDEANTWTEEQTFNAGITLPSVTVAPGNLISVDGNDTDLTPDPTCFNSGEVGMMTLIDTDETAPDVWTVCNGKSTFFVLPNVGSDVAASGEVLIGTGAGTAQWATVTGTLNVNEADGSPAVATVNTVKLPNGSLVDETGGVVRFEPGGMRPPFLSGRYYDCDNVCGDTDGTGAGFLTLTANVIYHIPFYVGYSHTFTHIALKEDNGAATAGNAKMSIYTMDTVGRPAARVVDNNANPVAIVGGTELVRESDMPDTALTPGWYYLSLIADAAVRLEAFAVNGSWAPLGYSDPNNVAGDGRGVMWQETGQTYAGGLPANTTVGNLTVTTTNQRPLRLFLKAN